jgi:hypothetical protein
MSKKPSEQEIRDQLAQALWAEYQNPQTAFDRKLKIAGLLEELTR